MTRALLVLVHGSPNMKANADMFAVVDRVRARGVYPIVHVGFMECNEPTIPDAIDSCVEGGADEIIAVPYFLHTGTHVALDLPELLADGRARHPHVTFRYGDYVGLSEQVTNLLADRASAA